MADEAVVLVHGLWMNGLESAVLRSRLRSAGLDTAQFSYRSVRASLAENAQRLADFCDTLDAGTLHVVAHSLGGLITLGMLEAGRLERPGRCVFLGSPVRGSAAARGLVRFPWGDRILGRSAGEALLAETLRRYDGPREIGTIAGTLGFGPGFLIADMGSPSDGTVAESETRLVGETDHLAVTVTHMGLLFSRTVADQTAHFLRRGEFLVDD